MLLDTNILLYSVNRTSPKKKLAQTFLMDNQDNCMISHQNINEALRILTHPKAIRPLEILEALRVISKLVTGLQVLSPTPETTGIHLNLIKKYADTSNQVFDAYLVATALTHGVTTIVTDNTKDFLRYQEIKVLNPFE